METLLEVIMDHGTRPTRLVGELDISTAPVLESALKELILGGGDVVLDLSELTFIDSTGLRSLLWAGRELTGKGRLVLRSPSAFVIRVLELTGVEAAPALTIERGNAPSIERGNALDGRGS